jgi:eukaryotic-like serine/threonine-protein kinase
MAILGEALGQYRIVDKIGEGGMGVVYEAHDTRLNRPVAIKILRPDVGANVDRLARFKREALLLAALNHPNIADIHGLEDHHGLVFLVLELVEGETLAQRLARGPIETRETIDIARQIACAMEVAHDKAIIHRDLKPANVKVTPEGVVKLLDFGLAKALSPELRGDDPTVTNASGHEGVVLGTPAYMAPEQRRGETANRGTDIWAFGCVLFEMLTGVSAFDGVKSDEPRSAVHHREQYWTALAPQTPPSLRVLVDCCLEINPKNRLRHVGDAALFLTAALKESESPSTGDAPAIGRLRRLLPIATALTAFAALGGFALAQFLAPTRQPSAIHVPMAPPSGLNPSLGFGPSLAVSPDGHTVVCVLESGTTTLLFMKRLEDLDARPMPGTHGARSPFFSPFGQWVGFYDEDDRKLKKVSIGGGEPVPIADMDAQGGAVWGPDDSILYASNYGLLRVAASGGMPQVVTKAEAGQHLWPALLPGAHVALFTSVPDRGTFDDAEIMAVPLTGGTPKVVLKSAYFPHYAATGHLVFVQGDSVVAAPFDPESLSVTGAAVTLIKGSWISSWTGYADFAFSDTGTLVYISGGPHPASATLASVDRFGNSKPLLDDKRAFRVPRVSPDGRQIAVTLADQQVDVWTYDLVHRTLNRMTDSPSWDAYPLWQPRVPWMTFSSMRDGLAAIYRQDLRSGAVEKLVSASNPVFPDSWSSDGRLLAFHEENPQTGFDIWIYSMDSRMRTVFLRSPFNEWHAEFSPDGRHIAYESAEGGEQAEVYVRPYPEMNPRRKISMSGGTLPRWSADGKELFYRIGGKLMVVKIDTTRDFRAGAPRELFEGPFGAGYDVLANGQGFVMVKEMDTGDSPTRINFVLNWFEELKRLSSPRR